MLGHTAESSAEYTYTVAGTRVAAPLPIAGLRRDGVSDGTTKLILSHPGEALIEAGSALSLGDERVPAAWIGEDGMHVYVAASEPTSEPTEPIDLALQVRRVVPFAALLSGRLTLHAAGVARAGSTFALVGESGAGKSTLGRALQAQGLELIDDDLIGVRPAEGGPVVPGHNSWSRLRGVLFLSRSRERRSVDFDRLSARAHFRLLMTNGFGELRHPKAVRVLFERNAWLARATPAWSLTIPDDLAFLGATAERLDDWFRGDLQSPP